ncbi:unnamed protein product [Urochloa humidicola]
MGPTCQVRIFPFVLCSGDGGGPAGEDGGGGGGPAQARGTRGGDSPVGEDDGFSPLFSISSSSSLSCAGHPSRLRWRMGEGRDVRRLCLHAPDPPACLQRGMRRRGLHEPLLRQAARFHLGQEAAAGVRADRGRLKLAESSRRALIPTRVSEGIEPPCVNSSAGKVMTCPRELSPAIAGKPPPPPARTSTSSTRVRRAQPSLA